MLLAAGLPGALMWLGRFVENTLGTRGGRTSSADDVQRPQHVNMVLCAVVDQRT